MSAVQITYESQWNVCNDYRVGLETKIDNYIQVQLREVSLWRIDKIKLTTNDSSFVTIITSMESPISCPTVIDI